ncbi:unnamed protein product, partial [Candidula unifasciata]
MMVDKLFAGLLFFITVISNGIEWCCVKFNLKPGLPQRIQIPSNQTSSFVIDDIPSDTTFAVFQLHTQRYNLSLSSEPAFSRSVTKNGTNVGMTTLCMPSMTQLVWYVKTFVKCNVTAVAYLHLYTKN